MAFALGKSRVCASTSTEPKKIMTNWILFVTEKQPQSKLKQ